jgi:hypothetical protein
MKSFVIGCAALLAVLMVSALADGELITGVTAYGWPNGRTSSDVPSSAVDGRLDTFTWTTESGNTTPGHLGLDFAKAMWVDRIRLYKDEDGGGGADAPSIKDLDILYTSDSTATPLTERQFFHVTSLTNGFGGVERMNAGSVKPNGTVDGDIHSSDLDGWASLSFDPVVATGVAIRFDYHHSDTDKYQHYMVYEFQAYGNAIPEPSTIALGIGGAVSLLGYVWRRRAAA